MTTDNNNHEATFNDAFLFARQLWDEDWVEAGCPKDQYPDDTAYDDTPGTFITNYVIAVTALLGIIILTAQECQILESFDKRRPDLTQHLFFFGLAYLVAGAYYQLQTTSSDDDEKVFFLLQLEQLMPRIAFSCFMLSMPGLILTCIPSLGAKRFYENMIGLGFAGFAIAMFFVLEIRTAQILAGTVIGAVALVLGCVIYYRMLMKKEPRNVAIPWILAMFFIIVGLIWKVSYYEYCGSKKAYLNCFSDCVFHYKFNHNAIYQLLVNIGVIFIIWGGFNLPVEDTEDEEHQMSKFIPRREVA